MTPYIKNSTKIRWSSDSREEIIAKLTDLGFIKTEKATKEKKKKKVEKKRDLSEQLLEISNLYKSGSITEEEFKKAKNKLLNK